MFPPFPRRSLNYTLARVAEVTPPPLIPRFEISGIDPRVVTEPAHFDFDLEERLHDVLAVDDPSLPFTGCTLPDEPHLGRESTCLPPGSDKPVRIVVPDTKQQRERARMAALRKQRHIRLLEAVMALRLERISPTNVVHVGDPSDDFDFSVIEDRDYSLAEVAGPDSRFRMRQVHWTGKQVRVIAAQRRAVLFMCGRAQGYAWMPEIVQPVNAQLDEEAAALRSRTGAGDPLVLSAGVGTYFNEPKASETPAVPIPRDPRDRAQDALAAMNLLSTVAMKRLVSFGQGLVDTYCKKTSRLLKSQKRELLAHDPLAHFPCETSDYSAITFELGGPHRRTNQRGLPYTYDPSTWMVLTALGDYDPAHGGQIILWDLGWVLWFAPGDNILIPPFIRYSFVAVRPGETRYSMIQWTGGGIRRFFENREVDDTTFAVGATEAEHSARECLRREAHTRAIRAFPYSSTLPTGKRDFKYTGLNPLY